MDLSKFDLNHILGATDYSKRKTKIICTIGYVNWLLNSAPLAGIKIN